MDGAGATTGFVLVTSLSGSVQTFIRDALAVIFQNSVFFNQNNFWLTALVEFLMICVPIGSNLTLTNAYSPHILVSSVTILIAIFVIAISRYRENLPNNIHDFLQLRMCERRVSVTYFRAFTNILAGFCILAVDFPIFPKSEAKSKHYGTTFMDGGVGMYVVSGAMVSQYARDKRISARQEMTDAMLMVALGVCRLLLVKWTGYDVQVMEYGVQWNFFFTLAFMKAVSTIMYMSLPHHVTPMLGPVITLVYQYILSLPSVYKFVMFGLDGHHSRSNFIDSNREGIFSAVGYLALYCYGAEFGRLLMKKRDTIGEWCKVSCICVALSYVSWMLFSLSSVYFDLPSRQLANAAYIFFCLVLLGSIISVALCLEIATTFLYLTISGQDGKTIQPSYAECPVLKAINYNGLFYFLVANLITGIINILMDTRACSSLTSYCILIVYTFFLSTLMLYMERKQIPFKDILLKPFRCSKIRASTATLKYTTI